MTMAALVVIIAVSRGDTRWVAIPVFTMRKFFYTSIIVRTDSGIAVPTDLRGKRIGVPEYQQTWAIWSRGILHARCNCTRGSWCGMTKFGMRQAKTARLRPAGSDDLGLRRALSDRLLPGLVGAMAFLAARSRVLTRRGRLQMVPYCLKRAEVVKGSDAPILFDNRGHASTDSWCCVRSWRRDFADT